MSKNRFEFKFEFSLKNSFKIKLTTSIQIYVLNSNWV